MQTVILQLFDHKKYFMVLAGGYFQAHAWTEVVQAYVFNTHTAGLKGVTGEYLLESKKSEQASK